MKMATVFYIIIFTEREIVSVQPNPSAKLIKHRARAACLWTRHGSILTVVLGVNVFTKLLRLLFRTHNTHTHAHTHTHTHTHTHARTHARTHTLTHSRTYTHTLSLSFTHTHTHIHTLTLSLSLSPPPPRKKKKNRSRKTNKISHTATALRRRACHITVTAPKPG